MSVQNQARDLQAEVRWMIRRDLPTVLEIEKLSFEFPWTEDDYLSYLRQASCVAMVAEIGERVVGVMVYESQKVRLLVTNFAVHPDFRRQGVGSAMVRKLESKLSQQRRNEIVLDVRESNLGAQLFFKSQGFYCNEVLRGFYEETGEDAYRMSLLAREAE